MSTSTPISKLSASQQNAALASAVLEVPPLNARLPGAPLPVAPLLVAPILPTLLRLAAPNALAMAATALATIAETAYVGLLGVDSLAAMALVFPMIMLQGMMSAGAMGGGVSSAVSRAIGAGDDARANALAVHAIWIGLSAGTVFTLGMLAFGPKIYALLGGQGESLRQAIVFSQIAFLGSIGIWLTNTLSSVIRASGNMTIPSLTLLLVALSQLLIGGCLGLGVGPIPRLGMPGIAAGSVIANLGGAAALYWYLRRGKSRVKINIADTKIEKALMFDILKVGATACLSPVQSVLTILILTHLVARFGVLALAGYGIGARLEFLLVPISFAFGVASVPLVGMAVGAGKIKRARQVAWTAGIACGVLLSLLGALVAVFPEFWTRLFTKDEGVIAAASLYFHWVGPVYGLFGVGLCLYFSSLAAGRPIGPVLAGTIRLVLVALIGWWLASTQQAAWTIYALVALGMVSYGLATALAVWKTSWGKERET